MSYLIEGGCSKDVEDEGELVVVIPTREKRPTRQHFGQYTPNGPHVNGLCVLLKTAGGQRL
jgi:hypothetical protein